MWSHRVGVVSEVVNIDTVYHLPHAKQVEGFAAKDHCKMEICCVDVGYSATEVTGAESARANESALMLPVSSERSTRHARIDSW